MVLVTAFTTAQKAEENERDNEVASTERNRKPFKLLPDVDREGLAGQELYSYPPEEPKGYVSE